MPRSTPTTTTPVRPNRFSLRARFIRWISRGEMAPVAEFAERLSQIDPRERGVRVGPEFPGDELAPIAASVDRFLERLDGFVEREQLFTATASHELRTPLAVIQGAAEILIEQTRDLPAAQKALSRIQRASSEMSEFIHALLMLSRETHLMTNPGDFCDIAEVVHRVIDDQREVLAHKPIQVEYVGEQGLRVDVPGSIATIVVGNLFRNAIAHTERGSIVCEIDGQKLSIRDTGAGIPAEYLERVFDLNFTTRPGGYGVGLYLSKRICDRYGWKIRLESTENGTTASVEF